MTPTDKREKPRECVLIVCNDTKEIKEVRSIGQGGLRCNDHKVFMIEMSEHQRVLEENKRLRKALENIDHCMTLDIARKISSEALSSGGE